MLVLGRKLNESILIDGNIRVTVVSIRHGQVRIGIEAPNSVGVFRQELLDDAELNGATFDSLAQLRSLSQPVAK